MIVAAVVVLALVAAGLSVSAGSARSSASSGSSGSSGSSPPPLPSTTFRARLVEIAESQLGYRTDPPHSYCNKYSAYWGAGTACGHGLRAEEWCADFAAWVWRKGGAPFTYGYTRTDINAAAGSFYLWAVAHGTWHPLGSGYTPQPGDVAVYGLDPTSGNAAHVAIVTGYQRGARGPDVVNGDGDRTGFSVVEVGTDQAKADIPGSVAPLSGYASPIRPDYAHS
ncbi:MAG: CHAP domain-containing protein [Acidimicrobiales bacterium]